MKIETLNIHGAALTVYLREADEAMPLAATRPLVLVVPGGGYEHVSAREADPVAVRFLAAGYHAAVLTYGVGEEARSYKPLRQIDGALAALRDRAAEWASGRTRSRSAVFRPGPTWPCRRRCCPCPARPAGRSGSGPTPSSSPIRW